MAIAVCLGAVTSSTVNVGAETRAAHGRVTADAVPPACGSSASPPARYDHVVWIWLENHAFGQVIGSPAAPYESALAQACGTATSYRSVGSPSLPNYIAATSGGTQGITDDLAPAQHHLSVDNIFRQVRATRRSARSYLESMPRNCTLTDSGPYWVHHNPAAYYVGANDRAACLSDDRPMAAFAHDLRSGLPAFSFVAPNACHDTHNCPVGSGDAWLARWMPQILSSPAYTSDRTAVFVVWDEYSPVPDLVIAPHTRPGTRYAGRADHYALLRTTEDLLGLSRLGHAGSAPSLRGPFGL